MNLPIGDIKVGDRFRFEYGEIDKLSDSIKTYGLIQPIVIDRENNLICGGRRLKACEAAGLSEVPIVYKECVSKLQLKEMELEENIQRKDFTWHEVCLAKEELHELKKFQAALKGEQWTMEDTAGVLGESVGNANQDIQLARALKENPDLLTEKNKSNAFKKVKRMEEDRVMNELANKVSISSNSRDFYKLADCVSFLPTLSNASVDLVITDPPWGVGIDEAGQIAEEVEYEDDWDLVKVELPTVYSELYRVLKPGSHAYIFFGIQYYEYHKAWLADAGFVVDDLPGLWTKGSHGGSFSPYREGNCYEVYFHCWKGDQPRKLKNFVPNEHRFARVTSEEKIHTAEKPVALIKELIENSSDPGDTVLDCYAGSGATARAALLSRRQVICCEKIQLNYIKGLMALEKFREENKI